MGGHEIKRSMVTHETQEFLDRFRPLEDNIPTSYVLVLPMVIVLSVSALFWGASDPPFISKGGEVTRKVTESVIT
jgi:hypothetical protein